MAVTEEWLNKVVHHVTTRGHDLGPADTKTLVAEVRRLRGALRAYGHHAPPCRAGAVFEAHSCTCGLGEALSP